MAHLDAPSEAIGQDDPIQHATRAVRTIVHARGTHESPFPVEDFERTVRTKLGLSESDPEPGFSRFQEQFRSEQLPQLFISDAGALSCYVICFAFSLITTIVRVSLESSAGDIPPSSKFAMVEPCHIAHPNLCAAKHHWCISHVRAATHALWEFFNVRRLA